MAVELDRREREDAVTEEDGDVIMDACSRSTAQAVSLRELR